MGPSRPLAVIHVTEQLIYLCTGKEWVLPRIDIIMESMRAHTDIGIKLEPTTKMWTILKPREAIFTMSVLPFQLCIPRQHTQEAKRNTLAESPPGSGRGTWACGHFSHTVFKNRDCSSSPEHKTNELHLYTQF